MSNREGIQGIIFENAKQLENELKNMHILWNDKRLINKKSTHLI